MATAIDLVVNGRRYRVEAEPDRTLLGVLRDDLGLTGTKYGCGEGQCGACTVLLDGQAARACLTPAAAVRGRPVTTIEGLAPRGGALHPIQQAFLDAGAMQCGYCTPGMIMASAALLRRTPAPSADDVTRALQGNVCRCGAYPRIVDAVRRAARLTAGGDR